MGSDILKFIEGTSSKKELWRKIGKAMHDHNMIKPGDKIAVGISGGKDSLTLLNALVRVKHIVRFDFEIIPVHVITWSKSQDFKMIEDYCKFLGLNLYIKDTNLSTMDFGKNPCFLCSRMRRGILYSLMKKLGIRKLALGHNKDDIIETFLMNMFFQGNMKIMRPAYHSNDNDIDVIRPLAYVEEDEIKKYANDLHLPIVKSKCPFENTDSSKRKYVKELINTISKENHDIRSTIFNSIDKSLI